MFKKKQFLLLLFFCFVFLSLNALTEEEKQEIFERGKREFIARLDSFIANNKPIISESYTNSDESAIKTFNGDIRQIDIFYKYVLYGDKITQKKGIDGFVRWYGNPERVEKYEQDSVFVSYRPKIIQLIYEFLDDEYPALQVTAARTLAYMGIDDSLVIEKLTYFANGTDSEEWNLENTLVYQCLHHYLYFGGTFTKKELEQKKQRAIKEIKDISKIGLNIIKSRNKKKKFQIKENKKSFNNYNLKRKRDLDWEGDLSADYCKKYWGPEITDWNPDYASYPGNDCANFTSQCLISGYYEDIKPFSNSLISGNQKRVLTVI
jgi:hypothetical protein